MNFFFSIKSLDFKTTLTIPIFNNYDKSKEEIKLFQAEPKNNKWIIDIVSKEKLDQGFYTIGDKDLKDNSFYFLANKNIIKKLNFQNDIYYTNKLFYFDKYTNSEPNFRASLEIYNENCFSSYQADYPYDLIDKKGSIVSATSLLLNKNAKKNKIFLKNIDINPFQIPFSGYLIDKKNQKIKKKFKLLTNSSNEINLEEEYINENHYIFTDKKICIPIYISISDTNISMEHTHPPHHYLYGKKKFKLMTEYKQQFYDIINKKN